MNLSWLDDFGQIYLFAHRKIIENFSFRTLTFVEMYVVIRLQK
jgi:hypothetical protein